MSMLEALERNVLREEALFYHRGCSWWILLQCWGTLRFSDHRGLSPDEHVNVGSRAPRPLAQKSELGSSALSRFSTGLPSAGSS